MTTETNSTRKPAHKIRHRDITVTIWRNESTKGPWFSVTPSRIYKKDDQWCDSDSFGEDDLLLLAKLLGEAHSWIMNAQQSARQAA
jgi:hypothetical protein